MSGEARAAKSGGLPLGVNQPLVPSNFSDGGREGQAVAFRRRSLTPFPRWLASAILEHPSQGTPGRLPPVAVVTPETLFESRQAFPFSVFALTEHQENGYSIADNFGRY